MGKQILLQKITAADTDYQVTDGSVTIPSQYSIDQISSLTFLAGEHELVVRDGKLTVAGNETSIADLGAVVGNSVESIDLSGSYPLWLAAVAKNEWQQIATDLQSGGGSELDGKVAALEKELADQRAIDEYRSNEKKLKKEVEEMQEVMESVAGLVKKLEQRKTDLAGVAAAGPSIPKNQLPQLKSMVIDSMRMSFGAAGGRLRRAARGVKNYVGKLPNAPLLVLVALTIASTVMSALIVADVRLVVLGLVLTMIQIGSIVLVNTGLSGSAAAVKAQADQKITGHEGDPWQYKSPQLASFLEQNGIEDLESIFVSSAFAEAYQADIANLTQTIEKSLDGEDLNNLQSNLEAKQKQLQEATEKLEQAESNVLKPDEYLRKRRELDTLKMEQRRKQREGGTEKPAAPKSSLVRQLQSWAKERGKAWTDLKSLATKLDIQSQQLATDVTHRVLAILAELAPTDDLYTWPVVISTEVGEDELQRQVVIVNFAKV